MNKFFLYSTYPITVCHCKEYTNFVGGGVVVKGLVFLPLGPPGPGSDLGPGGPPQGRQITLPFLLKLADL